MSITLGEVKSFSTAGRPTSLDFSNDGSLVAVGGYARGMTGGTLKILKTSDGSLVREYAHDAHGCLGVAFVIDSHDVAFLAQRQDGPVELWLTSEHQPRNLGPYSNSRATSLIRDRPGRLLGVVGTSVIVWDLVKGEVVANVLGAGNDLLLQAAFAEERPALIYIYGKQPGYIVKHDLRTRQDLASWAAPLGHESGTQVLPSPTGRYVTAIGYNASGHWIIDTTTGEKIQTNYSPEDFDSLHYAFTVDEVALVKLATTARAYRLADRKLIKGPRIKAHRLCEWRMDRLCDRRRECTRLVRGHNYR